MSLIIITKVSRPRAARWLQGQGHWGEASDRRTASHGPGFNIKGPSRPFPRASAPCPGPGKAATLPPWSDSIEVIVISKRLWIMIVVCYWRFWIIKKFEFRLIILFVVAVFSEKRCVAFKWRHQNAQNKSYSLSMRVRRVPIFRLYFEFMMRNWKSILH